MRVDVRSLVAGLALGLAVAVAVALVLQVGCSRAVAGLEAECSRLRSELSQCRVGLVELEARVERERGELERQLTLCRGNLTHCLSRVGELTRELAEATARVVELESEVLELRGALARLDAEKEALEGLLDTYAYTSNELVGDVASAWARLLACQSRLARVEEELARLEAEYRRLRWLTELLEAERDRLRGELVELREAHRVLAERLAEAQSLVEWLEAQLEHARRTVEELECKLVELQRALSTLLEAVVSACLWLTPTPEGVDGERLHRFYDEVLNATVASVAGVVNATGDAWNRSLTVLEFIAFSLCYRPDPPVRYVHPVDYTLSVAGGVLALPNETLRLGCGDSIDLALLAYGILESTRTPSEKVYLITIRSNGTVYAAVTVVHVVNGTRRFYVVDPAGNYVNGVGVYLNTTLVRGGVVYTLYLNPLSLPLHVKTAIAGLSERVYRVHHGGYYTVEPVRREYTDALRALTEWTTYHNITVVEAVEVHGLGVHEAFKTIVEAAAWLQTHPLGR